jgi:hypothetical protein
VHAPLQMGGYEGVLRSQSSALTTLQPDKGLWMHCIPRSANFRRIASDIDILPALPEDPDNPSAAQNC